ncbi:MAG: hypothetical protein RLZZ399_2619 [Verrucomicrobiota bacterium]|jgi:AraC family transcriptional regulator of arabinose operon
MIVSSGQSENPAGLQVERAPGFPHWTIGVFLSGSTEIAYEHRTYVLEQRQCVITPPNNPYRLSVKKREREVWAIFEPRPALVSALWNASEERGITFVTFRDAAIWRSVGEALKELVRWWGEHPPQLLLAENALERILLLAQWTRSAQDQVILDERIARVTAHIEEHCAEVLNVEGIARVAALSPSRLAHLFREKMGLTPMQYIEFRRIERAKQLLLTTDLPIKEIAMRTGFPNADHFSVRFRKNSGQSPRAFREKPMRRYAELNPLEG